MSIPQKPRTHAQAPSVGLGSCSGVGAGRPDGGKTGVEIRTAWLRVGLLATLPLTFALAVTLSACSDDGDRIDQNYGTDVGAGYHLPKDASDDTTSEVAAPVDAAAATDPDAAAADAGVVAPDAPQVEPSDATADGAGEATTG